jgi:hypothetical protein
MLYNCTNTILILQVFEINKIRLDNNYKGKVYVRKILMTYEMQITP